MGKPRTVWQRSFTLRWNACTLMNFVGSVGTLMEGSGLAEVLASTFGGVLKMLGRSFKKTSQGITFVI